MLAWVQAPSPVFQETAADCEPTYYDTTGEVGDSYSAQIAGLVHHDDVNRTVPPAVVDAVAFGHVASRLA